MSIDAELVVLRKELEVLQLREQIRILKTAPWNDEYIVVPRGTVPMGVGAFPPGTVILDDGSPETAPTQLEGEPLIDSLEKWARWEAHPVLAREVRGVLDILNHLAKHHLGRVFDRGRETYVEFYGKEYLLARRP